MWVLFLSRESSKREIFKTEAENGAILRPAHNIYGLTLAHLEFLNCDEEYSIQTSQKEIKTYVHCESGKKVT